MEENFEMNGTDALQWAREISKLPNGHFTLCFYPYSRSKGMAGDGLVVKERCKYRTQLPQDCFAVDPENLPIQTVSRRCATAFSSDIWDSRKTDINYIR